MPNRITRQIFSIRNFVSVLLLLAGVGLGVILDRRAGRGSEDFMPPDGIRAKPGPWGDICYTPFAIAAPDEILPVRAIEASGTHWFFENFSADGLMQLLQSADVPEGQREALLDPAVLHVQPKGIDL